MSGELFEFIKGIAAHRKHVRRIDMTFWFEGIAMRTVILGFAMIAPACLIAATALSRDVRELLENIGKALFVLTGGLAAFRYLPITPDGPKR